MRTIAVLCTAPRSNYRHIPGVELYDAKRDAYTFTPGTMPVIAHPPCAQWSRLRHFATKNTYTKDLAHFCLEAVRQGGGVLEHPLASTLFKNLPAPGQHDQHGFTYIIDQHWFGFPTTKRTLLYIVGISPNAIPPFPLNMALPPKPNCDNLSANARSSTTPALANWLITIARESHHESSTSPQQIRQRPPVRNDSQGGHSTLQL